MSQNSNPTFDHEKLDVYRVAIDYTTRCFQIARGLSGVHRHIRDQWLRASQSIPLNIAEGNEKRSLKDRSRFLDISRGSALECSAIQDVLVATGGLDSDTSAELKSLLQRIVAMLTRMVANFCGIKEGEADYQVVVEDSKRVLSRVCSSSSSNSSSSSSTSTTSRMVGMATNEIYAKHLY